MNSTIQFERAVWKHRTHTCPDCGGMPRLTAHEPDFLVVCGSCKFQHDGVRHARAEDAFAAWSDRAGPSNLPTTNLQSAAEMCARLMGWVDFPTDSGGGGDLWLQDLRRVPFGPYLAKDDWQPHQSESGAMYLALRFNFSIDIKDTYVKVTKLLPDGRIIVSERTMDISSVVGDAALSIKSDVLCAAITLAGAKLYMEYGPDYSAYDGQDT